MQAYDFCASSTPATRTASRSTWTSIRPARRRRSLTKAEVFTRITALLDEAVTHLNAAGATFPFGFSPGYAGFNTPPTFLTFNRALRARVAAYQGDWAGVLTALAGSFVNSASPLSSVCTIRSAPGGRLAQRPVRPHRRAALVAHPSLGTGRPASGRRRSRTSGSVAKTTLLAPPEGGAGLGSDRGHQRVHQRQRASVPIIRNEELILLRAEANINLSNLGPAVTDLNEIRAEAGNLPAYAGGSGPGVVDHRAALQPALLALRGGRTHAGSMRAGTTGSPTCPRTIDAAGDGTAVQPVPVPDQRVPGTRTRRRRRDARRSRGSEQQ